jgi:hypothetical protein
LVPFLANCRHTTAHRNVSVNPPLDLTVLARLRGRGKHRIEYRQVVGERNGHPLLGSTRASRSLRGKPAPVAESIGPLVRLKKIAAGTNEISTIATFPQGDGPEMAWSSTAKRIFTGRAMGSIIHGASSSNCPRGVIRSSLWQRSTTTRRDLDPLTSFWPMDISMAQPGRKEPSMAPQALAWAP